MARLSSEGTRLYVWLSLSSSLMHILPYFPVNPFFQSFTNKKKCDKSKIWNTIKENRVALRHSSPKERQEPNQWTKDAHTKVSCLIPSRPLFPHASLSAPCGIFTTSPKVSHTLCYLAVKGVPHNYFLLSEMRRRIKTNEATSREKGGRREERREWSKEGSRQGSGTGGRIERWEGGRIWVRVVRSRRERERSSGRENDWWPCGKK